MGLVLVDLHRPRGHATVYFFCWHILGIDNSFHAALAVVVDRCTTQFHYLIPFVPALDNHCRQTVPNQILRHRLGRILLSLGWLFEILIHRHQDQVLQI